GLRVGIVVAHATVCVRAPRAGATPDVRARRAGGRAEPAHPARLLPREPAEHLYRQADTGDAGRYLRPGEAARRAGVRPIARELTPIAGKMREQHTATTVAVGRGGRAARLRRARLGALRAPGDQGADRPAQARRDNPGR